MPRGAKPLTRSTFWTAVNITDSTNDCWNWKRSTAKGYGQLRWNKRSAAAHRVAHHLIFGTPVEGPTDYRADGFILHQCDNRQCCNPYHMTVGTIQQNALETYAKNRRTAPKGCASSNSRFTPSDIKFIRDVYTHSAASYRELAAIYGVAVRTIAKIITDVSYRRPKRS